MYQYEIHGVIRSEVSITEADLKRVAEQNHVHPVEVELIPLPTPRDTPSDSLMDHPIVQGIKAQTSKLPQEIKDLIAEVFDL